MRTGLAPDVLEQLDAAALATLLELSTNQPQQVRL